MPTWRQQAPDNELLPALKRWFETPMGRQLINEERALISDSLEGAFGHSLLEMSLGPRTLVPRPEAIRRHFCIGAKGQRELGKTLDVVSDFADLPVASESQDVVVVHHLLEFVANPHNMLRELERIVIPHGRLIIVGFNPVSLLGLRLLGGRLSSRSVWQQHVLMAPRLVDWLHLLGFETNHCWYGFHRIPVSSPGWCMQHRIPFENFMRRVPFGGTFVLSATKYRVPVTPIRMRWSREGMVNVRPLGAARGGVLNKTSSE